MADWSHWVVSCYLLALYNLIIAAGGAVLSAPPWPTVFGIIATMFLAVAGLLSYLDAH